MSDEFENKHKNGIFLVIVDDTDEFLTAIDYASRFANAEHGYVALLNIIEQVHVQNWRNIEERVHAEMRAHAEQMIWDAAGHVIKYTGKIPMVCIEEGDKSDLIIKTINDNENIVALVLASSSSSSPDELVTYFSGKGSSRLPVPLIIIPGHLEPIHQ